jgi:hypothetical protein
VYQKQKCPEMISHFRARHVGTRRLLPSRLYCRPWNLTRSCGPFLIARGLYRRWGIAPRPEDFLLMPIIHYCIAVVKHYFLKSKLYTVFFLPPAVYPKLCVSSAQPWSMFFFVQGVIDQVGQRDDVALGGAGRDAVGHD